MIKYSDLTPLGRIVAALAATIALLMLMGIAGWIEGGMN